ncbi:cystathionine gamma-synthase [Capsaspora owczarzaki ATCC 30864]|uniref:Cystathionine gamma-synthase n=1 Tax=Capsaspora owczarzaki (strain ATCC 30864) TaxID=595528 RepID=A0A0D2WPB5_CAPO3|nr:cystathionine gamma-synthase [Capsaspora owczarzaki ATCC 30864]KJE93155.1 cystathionine gamma-synthase [Capsaspora owczarzaki ATCC 30864]|eukprot:XP_004347809.1 cystathionine gamma-synthase [Capsaspora owczarzaki ATCC 30864]
MHTFNGSDADSVTSVSDITDKLNLKARGKLRQPAPLLISSLGTSVPEAPHAVSVCMPAWQDNVDYEEGRARVHDQLQSGYPRFCFHRAVKVLAKLGLVMAGLDGTTHGCLCLPAEWIAKRCRDFILARASLDESLRGSNDDAVQIHLLDFQPEAIKLPTVAVVTYPVSLQAIAKSYWQHSGEIVSSRLAERLVKEAVLQTKRQWPAELLQELQATAGVEQDREEVDEFIEEHFGRNLIADGATAKLRIRQRLAALVEHDPRDVFLYPTGMNAIFAAFQLLHQQHPTRKSIMFGFPYLDTLKILQKFGPGAYFLGQGDEQDMQELERLLRTEPILAVFCEVPSNPLCKTPDLKRLAALAHHHGAAVVVDDTIGNPYNVRVHPHADLVATSLTKLFSGASNVMGGSIVVSKHSPQYLELHSRLQATFEDTYFDDDAIFLERNSRDFQTRAQLANKNTEKLCDFLREQPLLREIHFPKFSCLDQYLGCKLERGGYGSLFSIVFDNDKQAQIFFDALNVNKGPSLGTNFTLCCPYTILAHYTELDFAQQYGISSTLVRVAVGLEEYQSIRSAFECALAALSASKASESEK